MLGLGEFYVHKSENHEIRLPRIFYVFCWRIAENALNFYQDENVAFANVFPDFLAIFPKTDLLLTGVL